MRDFKKTYMLQTDFSLSIVWNLTPSPKNVQCYCLVT